MMSRLCEPQITNRSDPDSSMVIVRNRAASAEDIVLPATRIRLSRAAHWARLQPGMIPRVVPITLTPLFLDMHEVRPVRSVHWFSRLKESRETYLLVDLTLRFRGRHGSARPELP